MPSKISYPDPQREKVRLLSYCLESPKEVLRKVFPTHRIYRYGSISLPLDSPLDEFGGSEAKRGLIITESMGPTGTQIVQTLSGIDFQSVRSELDEPREQRDMHYDFGRAMRTSMEYFLDNFGTEACYLDNYQIRQEGRDVMPKYEKRVAQLLEIAEIAFEIKNPTIEDLRKFLSR